MNTHTLERQEAMRREDAFLLGTWFNLTTQDEPLARNLHHSAMKNETTKTHLLSWLDDVGGAEKIHDITRQAAVVGQAHASRMTELVPESIIGHDLEYCAQVVAHPEREAVRFLQPDQHGNGRYVDAIRQQASHTVSVIQGCRSEIAQGLETDGPTKYRNAIREAADEIHRLTSVKTSPMQYLADEERRILSGSTGTHCEKAKT